MSKEELSPEDKAYYKRFEVKSLRVLLYFLAVVYLVFVFAVGGSQFSCSGSMIPDTNVGGNIATINEVSDDQKATFFFS
ncbi:hypothetical protein [Marinobacter salarius]